MKNYKVRIMGEEMVACVKVSQFDAWLDYVEELDLYLVYQDWDKKELLTEEEFLKFNMSVEDFRKQQIAMMFAGRNEHIMSSDAIGFYCDKNMEGGGALILLNTDWWKSEYNEDLFLLPSSIDEIMVVKKSKSIATAEDCKNMVITANATIVNVVSKFNNHVYEYVAAENKVKLVL